VCMKRVVSENSCDRLRDLFEALALILDLDCICSPAYVMLASQLPVQKLSNTVIMQTKCKIQFSARNSILKLSHINAQYGLLNLKELSLHIVKACKGLAEYIQRQTCFRQEADQGVCS